MIHPSTGETLPESITVRGIELVPEGGRVPLDIAVRYMHSSTLWSLVIDFDNGWGGRLRLAGFTLHTGRHQTWQGARDELEALFEQELRELQPLVRALGGNP